MTQNLSQHKDDNLMMIGSTLCNEWSLLFSGNNDIILWDLCPQMIQWQCSVIGQSMELRGFHLWLWYLNKWSLFQSKSILCLVLLKYFGNEFKEARAFIHISLLSRELNQIIWVSGSAGMSWHILWSKEIRDKVCRHLFHRLWDAYLWLLMFYFEFYLNKWSMLGRQQ